jgi:hypothetical protein
MPIKLFYKIIKYSIKSLNYKLYLAIECYSGQFRCSNGQCIDARLRCNLRYDCTDLSDEVDCDSMQN